MSKFTARRYSVSVAGYGSVEYVTASAGKARYLAFMAFRDALFRIAFRDFLARCTTLHLGPIPAQPSGETP